MKFVTVGVSLMAATLSTHLWADGIVIDKIYHPYVQPLEQELEVRMSHQDSQPGTADSSSLVRLAYGRSINDRIFVEGYVIGQRSKEEDLNFQSVEMEVKWQLTEQGEYWSDWALLGEIGKSVDKNIYEMSIGVITEKELGHWSATANFFVQQEWGEDIVDELESVFSLQARYRYSKAFESGLEFYAGQNSYGLGPVLLGQFKLPGTKKIKWEAGVIFGLEENSPDTSVRFLLEHEF